MAMTRKNYRAAAEVVREVLEDSSTYAQMDAASRIAQGLAYMFKRDNSNFQYVTFFTACGLDPDLGEVIR